MKALSVKTTLLSVLLFCVTGVANAASKNVSMVNGGEASFVESVFGVWSYNEKVSFNESGAYSLNLTDFGFGSDFDYVGAMISTSQDKIAEVSYFGKGEYTKTLNFNISEGEYWLSLFAITDSRFNTGTLGFEITGADVSQVPLPAGAWLFLSAMSFMGVLIGKLKSGAQASVNISGRVTRKANKKIFKLAF